MRASGAWVYIDRGTRDAQKWQRVVVVAWNEKKKVESALINNVPLKKVHGGGGGEAKGQNKKKKKENTTTRGIDGTVFEFLFFASMRTSFVENDDSQYNSQVARGSA